MTTELRYALEARLAGDALLNGMLDRDPNVPGSPRPAILSWHMGTAPPPVTCLTYRLCTLTPDGRFEDARPGTDAAVDANSPITDLRVDFESWTQKASSKYHENIFGRLLALLGNQAWFVPKLSATGAYDPAGTPVARVFKGNCLSAQPNLYDDKLNARLGLYSFRFRVTRLPKS